MTQNGFVVYDRLLKLFLLIDVGCETDKTWRPYWNGLLAATFFDTKEEAQKALEEFMPEYSPVPHAERYFVLPTTTTVELPK